ITRERIMKAAERLFAERGYEGTSVRAIVAKARVNQAAINYHSAGKEGLYREVLRTAFRALTPQSPRSCRRGEGRLARSSARRLRPPPAAAAHGARRVQPPPADFQLGSGAAHCGLSQAHERGGGAV